MKFKNLLLSTFILIGFISINSLAIGQSLTKEKPIVKHQDHQLINKLKSNANPSALFHQPQKNPVSLQKSDATNSRLNGISIYQHDGVMNNPGDSLRLYWGGDNHDPDLAAYLLRNFMYYPSNTPYIPSAETPLIIKTDSLRNYSWDSGPGVFDLKSKTVMAFDYQGNMTSEISMTTTNGIDWANSWRTLYTYDNQGNILSISEQDWTGTVWENDDKQEYTYDSQKNITEIIWYDWENGTSSWDKSYRSIINYESSNKITNLIEQIWNSTENSWNNDERYSMLYTGSNVTEVVYDRWSDGASEWKPNSKTAHTYNANNQLTITQDSGWDDVNDEWYNAEKQLFMYDDLGNNTSMIEQDWDSGSWNYQFKFEYTYSYLNISTVTLSEWDNTQFEANGRILFSYNDYDQCTKASIESWDGSDWTIEANSLELRFYYEEFEDNTTGIERIIDRNEFEIYPNPASDNLKVKLNGKEIQQIRIFDVTGKTVFESRLGTYASEANIPVSQLHNGVYILQVTSGNQSGTKPFVVSH